MTPIGYLKGQSCCLALHSRLGGTEIDTGLKNIFNSSNFLNSAG
jgi:hypothetical protein